MKKIIIHQQAVLTALAGRIDDFYLAGGTALSLFYFQHRTSLDLDFFTRDFIYSKIARVTEYLGSALKKEVVLIGQNLRTKTAKMAVYSVIFNKKDILKIDFVEDTVGLLKKTKVVNGIRVLSLEDIYLRKLYALVGMIRIPDEAGQDKFIGGRADAKDFYDIYLLSHTFIPLSTFVMKFGGRIMSEAVIRWFRTYNRMAIIDGILDINANRRPDYKAMERHFAKEVNKILERELGGL